MARTNNLTNFLTDVATAIKTKTGDSTLIPASQFDTKIANITTGHLDNTEYQEANDDLDDILEETETTPSYTQLEFIQSTGSQYINTEITAKSSISTKIIFEASNNDSDFQSVFGGDAGSSKSYKGFAFDINNQGRFSYNYYGGTQIPINSGFVRYENKLIFQNKYNIGVISSIENSQSQSLESYYNTIFNYNDVDLYLFASSRDGNAICHSNLKLYSCQIWDNEELVRDFIPAKNENGVVCLYDKVNKEFYYNQGTGDFIGGDEV